MCVFKKILPLFLIRATTASRQMVHRLSSFWVSSSSNNSASWNYLPPCSPYLLLTMALMNHPYYLSEPDGSRRLILRPPKSLPLLLLHGISRVQLSNHVVAHRLFHSFLHRPMIWRRTVMLLTFQQSLLLCNWHRLIPHVVQHSWSIDS